MQQPPRGLPLSVTLGYLLRGMWSRPRTLPSIRDHVASPEHPGPCGFARASGTMWLRQTFRVIARKDDACICSTASGRRPDLGSSWSWRQWRDSKASSTTRTLLFSGMMPPGGSLSFQRCPAAAASARRPARPGSTLRTSITGLGLSYVAASSNTRPYGRRDAPALMPTLRGGSWEALALAGRDLSTLGTNRAARISMGQRLRKDLCYVYGRFGSAPIGGAFLSRRSASNRSGHGVSIDRFVAGHWRQLAAIEVQHEQPNRRR